MFGTSGIRKVFAGFGDELKNFTPESALKMGLAIGTYINGGTVVVGRDIRTTALPIQLALTSGLVSTGCRVLTIGTVTTPTLAMSMGFLNGDCGVMITASHNTPEYIGIKVGNKSGLAFTEEQENQLEQIYYNKQFRTVPWDKIGSITEINDINSIHVNKIIKRLNLGNKQRPYIIIDPGNGSSYEIAPMLIKKLGCKFVTLNSNPDGHFPGRLSEPNSKNLQTLISFIKSAEDVDFGVALDGDADRVIFIDGNGKIIEPIRLLTFLAKQLIIHYQEINKSDNSKCGNCKYKIVTPINSSSVIEYVIEKLGGEVLRTQVGDSKVALAIKNSSAILGGENAGTYIWPEFHLGPDSLLTIAKVIEILSHTEKPFTELITEIPEFPFIKKEFDLKKDVPISIEQYHQIGMEIENWLKSKGFSEIRKNDLDGIRLDYKGGWIMVRRSGTSPIIRIEGEHIENTEILNNNVKQVAEILKNKFDLI